MQTTNFQIGPDGELIFDTDYLNDTARIEPVQDKRFWQKRRFWLILLTIAAPFIFIIFVCSALILFVSLLFLSL